MACALPHRRARRLTCPSPPLCYSRRRSAPSATVKLAAILTAAIHARPKVRSYHRTSLASTRPLRAPHHLRRASTRSPPPELRACARSRGRVHVPHHQILCRPPRRLRTPARNVSLAQAPRTRTRAKPSRRGCVARPGRRRAQPVRCGPSNRARTHCHRRPRRMLAHNPCPETRPKTRVWAGRRALRRPTLPPRHLARVGGVQARRRYRRWPHRAPTSLSSPPSPRQQGCGARRSPGRARRAAPRPSI